ncbi:MAG: 3-phosphoglycerate dehydrogenase family protein [Firmicutes bacterium]|nr:3-phosphoglycerate dehydrogenase family protein [Bacillota bacterium]
MTNEILALNSIAKTADVVFGNKYKLVKESKEPVAVVLRSFKMHDYTLPSSVLCVGRAGAGVNNIPLDRYASEGVVVFNTPGANANAVKELVILSMLLSARKVFDGICWSQTLLGSGSEVEKLVEGGKSNFSGGEILGKTLAVVGLGAIGILVANTAVDLGMMVIGYDPYINVESARKLNPKVVIKHDLAGILSCADYISLHTPLNDGTRGMICEKSIMGMKKGVSIINASRSELVDNEALKAGLKNGHINRYVTDFPTASILGVDNVVPIPHLGASTAEAEDNCGHMVANQIVDFIENGNITNSVNFPACRLDRTGKQRLTIIHKNVKGVLSAITDLVGGSGINISGFVSQSGGGTFAYAILDLDSELSTDMLKKVEKLENVVKVRVI